ncbi:TraB/GumN family protein [Lacibacter luteus]|uniref:TraB/GumN family protein n=1 Tax=Lacibacter luteus TaxID=2508719 RepID=A0A4Q1CJQ8_9BACT|nr:TraB/GumN family protein [Lacibacter luteus]RXK60618.1 TraB/GumN family protein [Lacibacter luteus]
MLRIFLLIALLFVYTSSFSQAFSKSGTDDLYLYKGTVLYKDGNGFIANVQKNFDSISVLLKYGEMFLRVIRKKENQASKTAKVNSGFQAKMTDTIIRHISQFQLDTLSYGRTKEHTKQGQNLHGNSLAYFLEKDDSVRVEETFYFNNYAIVMSNHLAEEFSMPVLTIERDFNFSDEATDEENISIIETGDINFPYEVKVPETSKNKVYHKTSSYLQRPIADNYKTGNSQFFAIINKQTNDTSFILGSMHATEAAFWNKKINQPEILQRLFSCNALYFESMSDIIIDREDSTNKSTTTQLRTLENELTSQQKVFFRQQYNTYLKESGIAYNDLITFHPLVIGNIFGVSFFAEKNIILEEILSATLQKELIKQGRIDFDFRGLDSNEEIREVNNFRWKYYTPSYLITELKVMKSYLKSVWLEYENGDIEKLAESVKTKYGTSFYYKTVDKRNENWLPRMIEGMKQEKCFFVVGSAHLGGPQGILHLLKEKGYSILPLKWLN